MFRSGLTVKVVGGVVVVGLWALFVRGFVVERWLLG